MTRGHGRGVAQNGSAPSPHDAMAGRIQSIPRALIVEFAGLPGAGKTTLLRLVAERLRVRGVPVAEVRSRFPDSSWPVRARKLTRVVSGAVRAPWYVYRSAWAIHASAQRSLVDAVKVLHNWLFVSEMMRRRGPDGEVQLFDQGIVQALWSIGYSAQTGSLPVLVAELQPISPHPDLLVFVEVDPSTAASRLASRPPGGSRLERASRNDPHAFVRTVAVWQELCRLVVGLFGPAGGTEIMTVNNDEEGLMARAADLAAQIEQLHGRGRVSYRYTSPRAREIGS